MKIFAALLLCAAASTCAAGCRPSAPTEPSAGPTSAGSAATQAAARPTARPEDKAETHATKISFRTFEKKPRAGRRGIWMLKVTDARSGAPIGDFDVARGRLMHIVVVRSDLGWLGRLNPSYNGGGTFTALATLPTPGRYRVFADYVPRSGGHESARFETSIPGATPKAPPLVPDAPRGAWIIKRVAAYPEGEPGKKGGAVYQVALATPANLRAGADAALRFQVRDAAGRPVKDLQLYLGAPGQCSVLAAGASKYLPLHARGSQAASADVVFDVRFPQPGLYKAWGQFMRRGQVISAPFVLKVSPRAAPKVAPKPGAGTKPGAP